MGNTFKSFSPLNFTEFVPFTVMDLNAEASSSLAQKQT